MVAQSDGEACSGCVSVPGTDDCQEGAQQGMAGAGESLLQISALFVFFFFSSRLIELL